jgi:calcium-independent phospholipase A2
VQKSLGKRAKESKLKQATELQLRGWIGKLYLKTIDVDKKETKKIHENPSSFEKMQVILIEDKSLLEKITNKINISKSTVECGICVKIFKNPSFDSMHSSVKNQQLTDDLKEQYHILLDLEDNENVQTFRMDSSNLKQQIDDIFESYSKRFISFTRYYIDDIGNGKINGHQLENIYQYMSEYPDHCLAHFAAAFGCSKYFDYEESTNASSSNFSVTQDSVKRIECKAENSHMTPIHAALVSRHNMHNKKIVVEKLLALGADLSARDKYSNTVLHFSANTNKEIVGILLSDHGIRQLSLKQDLCNCDNERPHDWAAYFGNNEVYQLLFEFYKQNKTDSVFQPDSQTIGNIDTDSFGSSTFKNFTQKIGLISFRSFVKRKGPLSLFFHLNLKSDFFPSLKSGKELIKLGVNVNAMDTEENTPLQLICANKEIKEIDHKLKWLLLLLTANAETNAKDKDGNTALHHLVSLDDRMGVKALLVFGADPSICNNYNRTPYRLATNENMKKLLKEIGLEVINDRSTSTDITPSSSTTILMPSSSTSLLHIKIGNTTGSKVLCLDGGGIKGLNILEILDQIEKMTKKSIIDSFDWVVGTSTGGIIALAFAAGRTVRQCKNLYFKLKDKVFGNVWDKITGQNSARLEKILQAEFLDLKMSGLIESQIKVAIATTALIGGNPTLVIYPNYKIDEWKNSDNYKFRDEFVWKVGRMTSAAPWYFKSVDNTFDGGLLANNPTLDALVQVSKYNEVHNIDQGIDPVIVSIGSGSWSKENTNDSESQNSYASCNIFTTLLQAFKTLKKSAIITDGHVVDHAERALKNGSYIRLQPQLTTKIKMDETNTEDLLNMMWETKVYMYQIREEINEFMNILK